MTQHRFRRSLGLVAVLMCTATRPGAAQTTARIAGQTLDAETSAPVAGVLVRLEGHDITAVTDSAGRFLLLRVPPGPQVIRAERIGYAAARMPLVVPTEGTVTREIRLASSALQIPGLIVTADPAGRARGELGTATVIEGEALRHYTAASLAGVLELVPGVVLSPPGLDQIQQIQLRSVPVSGLGGAALGSSSENLSSAGTLIVLDGVPLSNNANLQSLGPRGEISLPTSAGGGIDLRRIPATLIDRVEVIRGIPSARYGDLTQGAIIVDTRAGEVDPAVSGRADIQTMEASVVAGTTVGDRHTGTVLVDAARTLISPGNSEDQVSRVAAALAHRYRSRDERLTLDTRLDHFQLRQDSPEDSLLFPGRETRTHDIGIRISERARLQFENGRRLEVTASVERQEQNATTSARRVRGAQPFTDRLTEGRSIGRFVGGPYDARVDIDGGPWLVFGRIEAAQSSTWRGSEHELRGGLVLRREWNTGPGYQFDIQFPPQVTFNGVEGYDRPRRFDDVPPVATSAVYIDDRASLTFANGMHLSAQAGARLDVLHDGTSWFSAFRDAVIQPRLNVQFSPRPWLRLRGGAGRTAKHPTLSDLSPAAQYHDVVNVNWFANDPAERLAVLTTSVLDPTNPDLGQAVNDMVEAGIEVQAAGAALSLVAFRDRTRGGSGLRRTPTFLLREHFQLTDSTSGSGLPPEIIEPAFLTDTVPVLLLQPANVMSSDNRGLELTLTLPEISAIRTRFDVQGAWVRSSVQSDGLEVGTYFGDFQLGAQPRTPWWSGTKRTGERLLLNYRVTHQQPSAGLVMTVTVQHIIRENRRNSAGTDTLAFAGYITRTGEIHEVPAASRSAAEYADLRLPRTGISIERQEAPADWLLSLQVSKTLPLDGRLAFYAFNAFHRSGRYGDVGQQQRPFWPLRFGLDVSLSPARLWQ